jgi:uncharacterized oxidoreductase
MNMTGNTILITGGGSGIGRGLAEAFHKLGNQVVIAGRRQSMLDETTKANPGMKSLTLDVENADSIVEFAQKITAEFPTLNVVINNAGSGQFENIAADGIDVKLVESAFTTNVLGPIRLTAALLPHLKKQPKSTVANVTSGLAYLPLAWMATYCSTKAAMHSYTESLRYQLKDTSVEVLEIAPPYVQTHFGGEAQKADPRAMPLEAYIAETMEAFKSGGVDGEINVKNVDALRYAERDGKYKDVFKFLNESMAPGH